MATDMTGADLAQLESLSKDYVTTGKAMNDRAIDIAKKIKTAVDEFNTTSGDLLKRTGEMTKEIETNMGTLQTKAAGVTWQGKNREAFDLDLAEFGKAVRKGAAVTLEDVTKLKTEVTTKFNTSLEEFGVHLNQRIDSANTAANETSKAVTMQRDNLDRAANLGWGSK
jgi:hypothetical protein